MTSAVLVVAGTEATAIVLALSVLHMTGSTYWVSAVLAASLGLAMLLGPFGGVVADRYDRRRVLPGVAIAETAIFATAAFAATRPWELLVAAALAAVAAVPYGPAQAAAVQALIDRTNACRGRTRHCSDRISWRCWWLPRRRVSVMRSSVDGRPWPQSRWRMRGPLWS